MATIMEVGFRPNIPQWQDWDGTKDGAAITWSTPYLVFDNGADAVYYNFSGTEHIPVSISGSTLTAGTALDEVSPRGAAAYGQSGENSDGFYYVGDATTGGNSQGRALYRRLSVEETSTGITINSPRDMAPDEVSWFIPSQNFTWFIPAKHDGTSSTMLGLEGTTPDPEVLDSLGNSLWNSGDRSRAQWVYEYDGDYFFAIKGRTANSGTGSGNAVVTMSAEFSGTPGLDLEHGPATISGQGSGDFTRRYFQVHRIAKDRFVHFYWSGTTLRYQVFAVNPSTYAVTGASTVLTFLTGLGNADQDGFSRYQIWSPDDNEIVMYDGDDGTNWTAEFDPDNSYTIVGGAPIENPTKIPIGTTVSFAATSLNVRVLNKNQVFIVYSDSGMKARILSIV